MFTTIPLVTTHDRRHPGQTHDAGLLHDHITGSSLRRPATHHTTNKNRLGPHSHPRGRRRRITKSTSMDTHASNQTHHTQRAAPTREAGLGEKRMEKAR